MQTAQIAAHTANFDQMNFRDCFTVFKASVCMLDMLEMPLVINIACFKHEQSGTGFCHFTHYNLAYPLHLEKCNSDLQGLKVVGAKTELISLICVGRNFVIAVINRHFKNPG